MAIVDSRFGGGYSDSGFRRHWAARVLLFEERFGVALRNAEREAKAREAQLAYEYERSVRILQQRAQE